MVNAETTQALSLQILKANPKGFAFFLSMPETILLDVKKGLSCMNFTISVEKLHDHSPKSDYISDPDRALSIVEELRL